MKTLILALALLSLNAKADDEQVINCGCNTSEIGKTLEHYREPPVPRLGDGPHISDRYVADWKIAPAFSDTDVHFQLVFTASLFLDFAQTRDIKNHGWAHEQNTLLGPHPSDVRIRNYFVGVGVAHYTVSRALPSGWPRRSWQAGWLALEVVQVIKNKKAGFKFKF